MCVHKCMHTCISAWIRAKFMIASLLPEYGIMDIWRNDAV